MLRSKGNGKKAKVIAYMAEGDKTESNNPNYQLTREIYSSTIINN